MYAGSSKFNLILDIKRHIKQELGQSAKYLNQLK